MPCRCSSGVIASVVGAARVVVVGPAPGVGATPGHVRWVLEAPPGGGPVAALAAALPLVETDVVVLLAGDLPFAEGLPDRLRALLVGAPGADGVVPVDSGGRTQPLAAAYRTQALRRAVAELEVVDGAAVRTLLGRLRVTTVDADTLPAGSLLDVDTPDDLAAARDRAATGTAPPTSEDGDMSDRWTEALATELGLDLTVDTDLLLDLAREVAHAVERPAAPLTTFLVGYAAARAGGSAADIAAAVETARRLAASRAPEPDSP